MDRIIIQGGTPLKGAIRIGGAKNAALPLMAASLLGDQPLSLSNLPHLADVASMAQLLKELGVAIDMNGQGANGDQTGRCFDLDASRLASTTASYEVVRKMRASILVLGPLVARHGRAKVSLPGGCAIGTRPVDLHLNGLRQMGAEVTLSGGYIEARAPKGLRGAQITFPQVSVGATENLLMAATLAEGETVLHNAAREPEIGNLAHCLQTMGANIDGIGTDRLTIQGMKSLGGGHHAVLSDRIETASYAVAAAITGGDLVLCGAKLELIGAVAEALHRAGVDLSEDADGLRVKRLGGPLKGMDIITEPFPGFPTDMQAQFMAMLAIAEGASMITETIFENRFMHVQELRRLGADINVQDASAIVRGVAKLSGAPVMATDLRASVSLVLAGLAAEGQTEVNRVYHLDRGYEGLEEKLAACGARIKRVRG